MPTTRLKKKYDPDILLPLMENEVGLYIPWKPDNYKQFERLTEPHLQLLVPLSAIFEAIPTIIRKKDSWKIH